MSKNIIVNDDLFNLHKRIPEGTKFDLIIADPPYGNVVNHKWDKIENINNRINEIYENGEEDTTKGKAEINILQERITELENESKEEIRKETVAAKEQVTEEVPDAVQSFKDRLLNLYDSVPETNKKRRTSTKQYIAGQQSSIDPIEREAATQQ